MLFMSFWDLSKWWPTEPPPQQQPPQQIQVPQFVKDNTYLTVSGGLAVIKGPKTVILGAVTALFIKMVQSGSIPSQHKPLIDRFVEVIQPVLDEPMTVADMVAFCALMMFDDFAPVTSWWIGLTASLVLLTKQRRD